MIAEEVRRRVDEIRTIYAGGQPVPHVAVSDFLEEDTARALAAGLSSLPDRADGVLIGQGRRLAPAIRRWCDGVASAEFCQFVSGLTGLADLILDPTAPAGRFHRARDGDAKGPWRDVPAVDGTGIDRRLHLEIVLSEGWHTSFGGASELWSDPLQLDTNVTIAYGAHFNRCLVTEVASCDWRGLSPIHLPAHESGMARQWLSLFFCVRRDGRVSSSTMGGVTMVHRPMPARVSAGYTLTDRDVQEIMSGVRARDQAIAELQEMQTRFDQERASLMNYIAELTRHHRPPVIGFAKHVRTDAGHVWHDGWATPHLDMEFQAGRSISLVEVTLYLPDGFGEKPRRFDLSVGDVSAVSTFTSVGAHTLSLACRFEANDRIPFRLTCDSYVNPARDGMGGDSRDLAFVMVELSMT